MCGIAAIISTVPESGLEGQLKALLEPIRHRGHIHFEMAAADNYALGANRLPIVGRDDGQQPCSSSDSSLVAVLNGEIYNHRELRRVLEWSGYRFTTGTDTEVLANACHCWGKQAFERLDGMFAAIVYDHRDGSWMAARDPLGIKPLYYCKEGGKCYLASEIKSLAHVGTEIRELPPGSVQENGQRPESWYVSRPSVLSDTLEDNAATLRQLVSEAVRKRVQTDLPIAVFLSGGIDSGVVLYEAVRHHDNVTAFTIGEEQASDVIGAKSLCAVLDVPLVHVQTTEQELLGLIPDVIDTIESFEPNHIRGGTLSWLLARAVGDRGFRIALCGEGADELFGGYDEFALALRDAPETLPGLFGTFVHQLHRTQLQRVDRTSMRFTVETRVPYLDRAILDFAAALPVEQRVRQQQEKMVTKAILREAYRGILPDETVFRQKEVLSLGAGYGSNGPEGPFFEHARNILGETDWKRIAGEYPQYQLRNREEAYYFSHYIKRFGKAAFATQRPRVNATGVKNRAA